MKMSKQIASFVLGVAVGFCLYSLLKFWPLATARVLNVASPMGASHPRQLLRSPWVKRALPSQVCAPVRVQSPRQARAMPREVAEQRMRVQPKPACVKVAEPAAARVAAKDVVASSLAPAAPAPAAFKAIGYLEKAGGQVEAIILQENQIQVVHIGDLIAGRYRVTEVSPEFVDAVDETQVQSPMAKPDGAKSEELTASVAKQPIAPPALDASARAAVVARRSPSRLPT